MSSPANRRMQTDVMKLCMSDSDFDVQLINDSIHEFYVRFRGPEETPFAGGVWRIRVELPDQYPYKSPSIGFINTIFHPNIDEGSGSVCLDVINQTWSPMFDMVNIFETFLPQLLRYPNPADPLNGEAANLLMRDPNVYNEKVKQYVKKYATKAMADSAKPRAHLGSEAAATAGAPNASGGAAPAAVDEDDADEDEDEEMSDAGSYEDEDDDPANSMDL